MDAEPLPSIEYASGRTVRQRRRMRWSMAFVAAVGVYVGSYLVARTFVEPAANLAFFVYPGSATVDECCYYGFWPLYKADRFLTGRKHNRDRTPFVMPEGDAGL
jgi:hypothetical protein